MKRLALGLGLGLTAVGAYGRIKHKQSAPSFFLEKGMRAIGYKDRIRVADPDHFNDSFSQAPDEDTFPTRRVRVSSLKELTIARMQVFSWNEDEGNAGQPVIVYLHGGGYVYRASPLHYAMVNRVARMSGAQVLFPTYGLGPKYRIDTQLPRLVEFYQQVIREHSASRVVLMGDSAGGGLVLSLLQALCVENLPMPAHGILLSPWVNLAMDHPQTPYYDAVEPMISLAGSLRAARCWVAEGMSMRDPLVSPVHMSPEVMRALPPMTTFVGTHELFFPDIRDFDARLRSAGCRHELVVAPRMVHVYPVFPTPEGHSARKRMAEIISMVAR